MADNAKTQNGSAKVEEQNQQRQFAIQRIYVKDLSLEVPNSPKIFLQNWEPELNIDLATKADPLEANTYEVVLSITVTVKIKETTAFLVEIKQAGIFTLQGFAEEHMRPMLGAFCPNVLFPYARSNITDIVTRAGFPQLYLAPVNFDALYEQHERERKAKAEETPTDQQ